MRCDKHNRPMYHTNKGSTVCILCDVEKRNGVTLTPAQKKAAYLKDYRQRKAEGKPSKRAEKAAQSLATAN